jgi:hypothetical protein
MSCATCGSRPHPTKFEKDFWYAVWNCDECGQQICNQPDGENPCYVKHVKTEHTREL